MIHRSNLVLALATCLLAATARADVFFDSGDVPVAEHGRFYFGFGASAYFFDAPRRTNVGALYEDADPPITTVNLHDFDPDDTTPLYGLTAGWVLAPGGDGALKDTRVELTGHYFGLEESATVRRTPPFYTDFLAIDGTGFVGSPGSPFDTIEGQFAAQYDYADLGVIARSDVELGPGVLTPSFGLAVARLEEHHSIHFRNLADGDPFNRIREDVETWYGGPTLGAQIRVPLFDALSFRVGGTAWLAYAHSEYDGRQNFAPGGPTVSAGDVRDDFGFRGTASGSLAYELGPAVLAVTGGVDYWDYAPVIEHPRPPLGVDYDSVTRTPDADIDAARMTNYFVGLTLAIRLGR